MLISKFGDTGSEENVFLIKFEARQDSLKKGTKAEKLKNSKIRLFFSFMLLEAFLKNLYQQI
jgi:hypothetical protein